MKIREIIRWLLRRNDGVDMTFYSLPCDNGLEPGPEPFVVGEKGEEKFSLPGGDASCFCTGSTVWQNSENFGGTSPYIPHVYGWDKPALPIALTLPCAPL